MLLVGFWFWNGDSFTVILNEEMQTALYHIRMIFGVILSDF